MACTAAMMQLEDADTGGEGEGACRAAAAAAALYKQGKHARQNTSRQSMLHKFQIARARPPKASSETAQGFPFGLELAPI